MATSSEAYSQYLEYLKRLSAAHSPTEPGWQYGGETAPQAPQQNQIANLAAKYGAHKLANMLSSSGAGEGLTGATEAGNVAYNAGADLAGGFSPAAETGLQSIQPGLASTEAANTAFNAGGNAATEAATGPLGSAAPYLGAAGAALGAYGTYRNLTGHPTAKAGAMSGAALGGGLAAMAPLLGLGPVGWGGLALAMALGGGGGAVLGKLGQKWNPDHWMDEQNAVKGLANKGITGWDLYSKSQPVLTKGRSKDQLINRSFATDYIGKDPTAGWVNNKFAQSRNEKDLRPEDIWGYSAFGQKYGNDWFGKFNEGQRKNIAQAYLDAGAVSEGKGAIKLNSTADLDKKIQGLISTPSLSNQGSPGRRPKK